MLSRPSTSFVVAETSAFCAALRDAGFSIAETYDPMVPAEFEVRGEARCILRPSYLIDEKQFARRATQVRTPLHNYPDRVSSD
jgi:hypothetical protein